MNSLVQFPRVQNLWGRTVTVSPDHGRPWALSSSYSPSFANFLWVQNVPQALLTACSSLPACTLPASGTVSSSSVGSLKTAACTPPHNFFLLSYWGASEHCLYQMPSRDQGGSAAPFLQNQETILKTFLFN